MILKFLNFNFTFQVYIFSINLSLIYDIGFDTCSIQLQAIQNQLNTIVEIYN
jgi:hypothetical protein